ncbi:Molybdopterin converting factor, small subunit [Pseudarthrobacter enclensis]|uniref:Molybdopterin synthase sulfur carrier subunit n=1 Tax=Pseudarthrobacter enclensis TaxID=993070 RepID=A0A0V8IDA6_9MICC|nr:MoaD/ThiS family protein [Pseudarthrobacter enclensis]KSU72771.1 molybdopterin synthase sulfur carrier subunit [Pseudarthrobacter enclensis]SCC23752.1 Molybdopterin converting factor, small subunit [Pseudarthrobacter enclensis]
MHVRYFAAARAAAGFDEEKFDLPAGATVADLLEAVLAVPREDPPAGTPRLATILARSSFLLNEVAVRDHATVLGADDVVDVLPPFAGG